MSRTQDRQKRRKAEKSVVELEGIDVNAPGVCVLPPTPKCYQCRHKIGYYDANCHAFPMRIPDPIWLSKILHHEPYPGDNGLQFEPMPESEEERSALRKLHLEAYFAALEAELEAELEMEEREADEKEGLPAADPEDSGS